ncbi:MAG TPA: double-strand break repair helicase AddA [Methylocella sp.]|nr:double-strand break repair helicase AddA [Methylocella sp.]
MPAEIPSETLRKQFDASNPKQSVWVSANAGSGKTHVLASRVIRLLLHGVAPSKILCLTFTKAAAANMAERISRILSGWTGAEDAVLREEIQNLGASSPDHRQIKAARQLFARVLETPGGLKIQTIHAFCERVLHVFPFEANVPARFEVMEEQQQAELLSRARHSVLEEASRGQGALGAALEGLIEESGPSGFDELIKEALQHEEFLHPREMEGAVETLRGALGLRPGRDVACIEREMAEKGIAPKRCNEIAALLDRGKSTDQRGAEKLRRAFAAYPREDLGGYLEAYESFFFNDEGEPRRKLLTSAQSSAHPSLNDELCREQSRLEKLREERKAAATFARTQALIEVAGAISERYREYKSARSVLDYGDLIANTLALLERSDARWVLYKLDSSLEHILVDEAQDTSEAQWKILESLTGEFASFREGGELPRSFFAVGDEKQSIFSFQGADRGKSEKMQRSFAKRFDREARAFKHVRLTSSFRSAPGVLAAIDRVFEHSDHKKGVISSGEEWMPHDAVKRHLPTLVEVWPPVTGAPPLDTPDQWTLPENLANKEEPATVLARRIAKKIEQLIGPDSREFVHDAALRPRPIEPSDILILVRKRKNAFFETMIRALKESHIPTAGADRLDLKNHIAVMDLIAAGRASLLAADDLSLASVLKSPLIGFDDEDLIALAPGRAASLAEALRASPLPKHMAAERKLAGWRSLAGGGPFAFYTNLLSADGGRRDLEARLGPEAGDAIDEFLRLAMAHESSAGLSLAVFLEEVSGLDLSIKREIENGGNAVRVMTVHGAKGLEAKIVFLPETCGIPTKSSKIFRLHTAVPSQTAIAWSPRKELDCSAVAEARERKRISENEEYRRLLYVALTRAEERLYIAGFYRGRKPGGSWAAMMEAAFYERPEFEKVPSFWNADEALLRYIHQPSAVFAPPAKSHPEPAKASVPAWLRCPAPAEDEAARAARPSSALTTARSLCSVQQRTKALARGRLLHELLAFLPEVAAEQRRAAAHAFFRVRAKNLEESDCEAFASEACKIIDLPELAGLFGLGSRAEVPVLGTITHAGGTIDVRGRVDRVAEAGGEVLVADFKTDDSPPTGGIPAAYVNQLALYRAALAPLWPGKPLRVLIIWTKGPSITWVAQEKLDAALTAYVSSPLEALRQSGLGNTALLHLSGAMLE